MNNAGEDDEMKINFDSIIVELQKEKDELIGDVIFHDIKDNREIEEIDRVLKLIQTNKIKIDGRFKIERSLGEKGREHKKICWEGTDWHYLQIDVPFDL